jgi:hypothetical protein
MIIAFMGNGKSDTEQLLKLREDCTIALRRFVEQANKTCEIFQEIKPEFPLAVEDRQKILDQRQSENLAYDQYQIFRHKLFEAARWV